VSARLAGLRGSNSRLMSGSPGGEPRRGNDRCGTSGARGALRARDPSRHRIPDSRARAWLRGAHRHGGLASRRRVQVSAVAWTELLCGPVLPARVEVAESLFGGPVALDGPEAAQAAKLRWKGELTCSPGETLVETGHRFRGGRGPALLVLAKGPAGLGEEARSAPPSTSMSSAGEMAVIPLPSGHCPLPPCTR